jgi:hypothetical protein
MFAPNRVAVYLTSGAALLGALAPAVADLDINSTVGIVGGLGAIALVVRKWLEGWQAHEARGADTEPGDVLPALPHLPTTDPVNVATDLGDAGARGARA